MKNSTWVVAIIVLGLLTGSAIRQAHADDQWLFTLGTDALTFQKDDKDTNLQCQFYVSTDNGAITGIHYGCIDQPQQKDKAFTIAQIKSGVVIKKTDDGDHVVCSLQAGPDFDVNHGGTLTMTTLYSGVDDSTRTFSLEIQNIGGKWIILSGADAGHKPFKWMFWKKHEIAIIGVVGVERIDVQ